MLKVMNTSDRIKALVEKLWPRGASIQMRSEMANDMAKLQKLASLLPEVLEELTSQYYYDGKCTACADNDDGRDDLLAKVSKTIDELEKQ